MRNDTEQGITEELCVMTQMKNLKRNWLVVLKLKERTSRILTQALESLKKLHLNELLLTKVYNFLAKKVQGSYLLWH